MKNIKYEKLFGIVFSLFILTFSVIFLFSRKIEFSENENRYLASFPHLSFFNLQSGKLTEGIENYLADHFPFRDFFMSVKTKTELTIGKEMIDDVYIGSDEYLIQNYQKPENGNKIVDVLNQFYGDMNYINMNLMLVPTSITINEEKLPSYAPTYSQVEEMNAIYSKIKFDTIDVTEALRNGNQEYQMFYRLDHHWTSYGAYYAYLEFCKSNNITPLAITEFDIQEVTDNFNGTLYSKTNLYTLTPDKIHIFIPKNHNYEVNYVFSNRITDTLYEEKYLDQKDKYSYFLDNNHPLITITNQDIHNGKELLIIKDSYANSMIPFLVNHYEKVHVIDPRFYKFSIEDYLRENTNIRDLLILYNMNTIDQDLGILTIG